MYYKINNKLTLKTINGRIERKIRIFSWINLTFSFWGGRAVGFVGVGEAEIHIELGPCLCFLSCMNI